MDEATSSNRGSVAPDPGSGPGGPGQAFYLTLGEAARQLGCNKSILSRAVKHGRLSAVRCAESNSFKIDPAELQRYADAVAVVRSNPVALPEQQRAATGDQEPATPTATALVEERAARQLAEARLSDLKGMLEELRGDRDQWREQAMRLALPAAREPRRWRWWRRAG